MRRYAIMCLCVIQTYDTTILSVTTGASIPKKVGVKLLNDLHCQCLQRISWTWSPHESWIMRLYDMSAIQLRRSKCTSFTTCASKEGVIKLNELNLHWLCRVLSVSCCPPEDKPSLIHWYSSISYKARETEKWVWAQVKQIMMKSHPNVSIRVTITFYVNGKNTYAMNSQCFAGRSRQRKAYFLGGSTATSMGWMRETESSKHSLNARDSTI